MSNQPIQPHGPPVPNPPQPPGTEPDLDPASALARLRSAYPLDPDRRAAYLTLATDTQRSAKGAQTKARSVLKEGTTWAVEIDAAFRTRPVIEDHYSRQRFGYLIDLLCRLDARVRADEARSTGTGTSRSDEEAAREKAKAARDRLVKRLKRYAGERETLLEQIAAQVGPTDKSAPLVAALGKLVELANAWRAQTDPVERVLVEDAGLTEERIAEVKQAADELAAASGTATLAGKLRGSDSPLTNIAEGAVLLEMAVVMHALEEAHQDDPAIPKLVPGPGTRSVLGSHSKKAADDASTTDKPADTSGTTPPKP